MLLLQAQQFASRIVSYRVKDLKTVKQNLHFSCKSIGHCGQTGPTLHSLCRTPSSPWRMRSLFLLKLHNKRSEFDNVLPAVQRNRSVPVTGVNFEFKNNPPKLVKQDQEKEKEKDLHFVSFFAKLKCLFLSFLLFLQEPEPEPPLNFYFCQAVPIKKGRLHNNVPYVNLLLSEGPLLRVWQQFG